MKMKRYAPAILVPLVAVMAFGGCTAAGAPVTEPPGSEATAAQTRSPMTLLPAAGAGPSAAPVSASHPSDEAADAMAKCHIGDQFTIDRVIAMGLVSSPADLPRYIPLTGREPILKGRGPVWVVQLNADVPQPGGGEVWTDPTCVVSPDEFGFFATGPVTVVSTGKVLTPEAPAVAPDLKLPPLAP